MTKTQALNGLSEKKTRRNPYLEPSMTLIPCGMRNEKNAFLIEWMSIT